MTTRSLFFKPGLYCAVTASLLLALSACSSSDDDDGDGETPTPDGTVTVSLSPDQEVPPVTTASGASGDATLSIDDTNTLSGSITVSGLTGQAQMAHIHRGFNDANGAVVVALESNDDGTVWSVPENYTLMAGATPDSIAENFARGGLYFNVHTQANPTGEIRGQIVPDNAELTVFTVSIENVSTDETLPHSLGSSNVPLSPGAYIVHRGDVNPLIQPETAANSALEMVAEDGDPTEYPTVIPGSAIFNTPVGMDVPGAIGPGGAYEFTVSGIPGDKLSLVTMFVPSNDYFYTFSDDDGSLSLFDDDGNAVSGDQSSTLAIWDAGTEQDEEPGTGPNQVQRQPAANTGPAEGAAVASLESLGESVTLNGPVMQLTITPQ